MAGFDQSAYVQQYMRENVTVKKVTFSRKKPEDVEILRWLDENKINFSGLVKEIIKEKMEDVAMKVINKAGAEVSYNTALELMDDGLREELTSEDWDSEQDFFRAYEEAHEKKFGEEWELSKENPTY